MQFALTSDTVLCCWHQLPLQLTGSLVASTAKQLLAAGFAACCALELNPLARRFVAVAAAAVLVVRCLQRNCHQNRTSSGVAHVARAWCKSVVKRVIDVKNACRNCFSLGHKCDMFLRCCRPQPRTKEAH